MGITDVIRGDDHVNNTPRQINIYRALGAPVPHFAHMPMILDPEGAKLSKRSGAANVMSYKEEGYLPHALVNYLARLGWSHGDQEIFSRSTSSSQLFAIDRREPEGLAPGPRQAGLAQPALPQGRRSRRRWPRISLPQLVAHGLRPGQRPESGRRGRGAARPRADAQGNGRARRMSGTSRSRQYDEAAVAKHFWCPPPARRWKACARSLAALGEWTVESVHGALQATGEALGAGPGQDRPAAARGHHRHPGEPVHRPHRVPGRPRRRRWRALTPRWRRCTG